MAVSYTHLDVYKRQELGALKNFKDDDFYELIIFTDVETNDSEIQALIHQLPKFNKLR